MEAESEVGEPREGLSSFDSVESTSITAEFGSGSSAPSDSKIDMFGTEEDPEIVARAVRTLMNKDQEG